jgi:protein-disulfide isomerase
VTRASLLCAGLAGAAVLALVLRGSAPAAGPPAAVLMAAAPSAMALGEPGSAHRLVLFTDYECAVCGLLERDGGARLRALAESGGLRLEIRHYPLAGHRRAPRAAAAALCAARQGGGWPMHVALFATAGEWRSGSPSIPWFLALADSLGLDREAVARCVAGDEEIARALAADLALGRALGLVDVPAAFLDGRPIAIRTPRALVRRVGRATLTAGRYSP